MLVDTIGAEFRQVVEREHDGEPARVVIAVRTYDTSPEDLWDAVTNPERIPRRFALVLPLDDLAELRPDGVCQHLRISNVSLQITARPYINLD